VTDVAATPEAPAARQIPARSGAAALLVAAGILLFLALGPPYAVFVVAGLGFEGVVYLAGEVAGVALLAVEYARRRRASAFR